MFVRDLVKVQEFEIRAQYSAFVRRVLMGRAKFDGFNFDPFPFVNISSFAMPGLGAEQESDEDV